MVKNMNNPALVVPKENTIRWVKIPSPGQFRGEGVWKDFDLTYPNNPTPWSEVKAMNFLPTKELPKGIDPDDS
jgi:hypothetical protein